uniref:Uncharacterized protein n=1 Tax=Anguilla anguilla TaxID=7936 RepID=A0A0E9RKE5_ANGAN
MWGFYSAGLFQCHHPLTSAPAERRDWSADFMHCVHTKFCRWDRPINVIGQSKL